MLTQRVFIALALGVLLLVAPAAASQPPQDIVGIRLGMPKPSAHARLAKIGTLQREERKRQEVWSIREDRFRAIMIGYDEQGQVRYVTAVARDGGRRVRYRDLANPKDARHDVAGKTHTYTWTVKPSAGSPYLMIAIGRDPTYLTYMSLKRPMTG